MNKLNDFGVSDWNKVKIPLKDFVIVLGKVFERRETNIIGR